MSKAPFTLLATVFVIFAGPPTASAKWEEQYSIPGSGNNMIAVGAGTGINAVASGVESQMGSSTPFMAYTKDGKTWTKIAAPGQFSMFLTLSMPDEKFVYGGGLGFYQSKDGGASYSEVKLPSSGGMFDFTSLTTVHAIDPVHAFVAGGNKVYWTLNSLQWEVTEPVVEDQSVSGLFFLNSQKGWIAGGQQEEIVEEDPFSGEEKVVGYNYLPAGFVMHTEDGGKSFGPLVIGANEYFKRITFVDQNIGLAVASSNDNPLYIKRTTDGGKTWTDIGLPPVPNDGMVWMHLSKIVMTSPLEGWTAGSAGWEGSEIDNMGNAAVVLHTGDGGVSWDYVEEAQGQGAYLDIDFGGKHWGWAVGTFGRIMAYTDGTEWIPPEQNPEPEQEVVEQPGGDTVGQDVATWNNVFGVFGDDVLIGANSFPAGVDGSGLVIGKDNPECEKVTQTSGCSAGSAGSTGGAWLLLVAVGMLALPARRRFLLLTLLTLTLAVTMGCEEEETVTVCPDLPVAAPAKDIFLPEKDVRVENTPFQCGLTPGEQPAAFGGLKGRVLDHNNFVVYVKKGEEGGSDLYLYSPDSRTTTRLTEFSDPEVDVWNPSWSPDRNFIAFVTNYRAKFNDKQRNVWLISLDRELCYQVTPGIESARFRDTSNFKGTITGSFKYGQGAVAAPVTEAEVAFPGGPKPSITGPAGEFVLKVPPGAGTIVLRGEVNGMKVKGVAEYDVGKDIVQDLGTIMAFVEAEYHLGALYWTRDGSTLYTFVEEQLEGLVAIDMNSGDSAPFLAQSEDSVVAFAPFPDAELAVVAFKSDPAAYFVYTLTDPPEIAHEFEFPGQEEEAFIAVSPMRFLATVQADKLVVLGSNQDGDLEVVDATPTSLSGLVPNQLDWANTGDAVVAAVANGTKTNLVLVDINAKTSKAITTDGRSSQPAWFGR